MKNYVAISHEVRSFLYTENTSCKLLYKPKDWVAAEIKNNIYEIDCSNSKTVDFSESKRSLKRFFKNYDCEKNQIAEHCWEEDRIQVHILPIKMRNYLRRSMMEKSIT